MKPVVFVHNWSFRDRHGKWSPKIETVHVPSQLIDRISGISNSNLPNVCLETFQASLQYIPRSFNYLPNSCDTDHHAYIGLPSFGLHPKHHKPLQPRHPKHKPLHTDPTFDLGRHPPGATRSWCWGSLNSSSSKDPQLLGSHAPSTRPRGVGVGVGEANEVDLSCCQLIEGY